MRYAELDRFLVPLGAPLARRYFTNALYVPQGPGGRMRRAIGQPRLRRAASSAGIEHLQSMLEEVPDVAAGAAIYLRDYATSDRGRTIAFFFRAGEAEPSVVVKTQLNVTPSLRRESEAIEQMRAFLPPELKKTLPRVLRFHTSRRGELLAMTSLPGRSAYIDMQGSLTPWRFVDQHFDAAARWLAAFHLATRTSDTSTVNGVEVPHSAMHGDFWPRNVLLDADGSAGVVDWEHFVPSASPLADLLHYAKTYGINYPWSRYRRVPEAEALRRTFRETNRVSRAVRWYFERYAELTGIPVQAITA
jgi:hypothetical protein